VARLGFRLCGRPLGTGAVLYYHRVAAPAADPLLLAVSPPRFSAQLEVLRRRAHVVPLVDLAEALAAGRSIRKHVALTFDDGYADVLTAALPLLERHEVPVTVFVTTGNAATGQAFWWDELEHLVLRPPRLPSPVELTLDGRRHRWVPGDDGPVPAPWSVAARGPRGPRQRMYLDLMRLLRPLASTERERALLELRALTGGATPAADRPLARAEVERLAASPLVTLGAHTISHPALAGLPPAAQRDEIRGSKRWLEEVSGRPVPAFAYPFGEPRDYTSTTVAQVHEAGFAVACTTQPGAVWRGVDRLRLPRLVVRDWDSETFGRILRSWLGS
jgi:peptidoglycan/xylan/chitin deacetylase (PgdA/CDA1 family)